MARKKRVYKPGPTFRVVYIGVIASGKRHPNRQWRAQIRHEGRLYNLGYYGDSEVAARVRDVAALLLQGPDANLNFDGTPPPGITEDDIRGRIEEIERRWGTA